MMQRYFRYYFEEQKSKKKESESLIGILDAYCSYNNSSFKNSFSHNGESIFLLKEREKHYLFLKTKDTEIIKTINRQDIKVEEIATRLMSNESVGFASYVYIDDCFLGFSSTQLAPTVSAFASFLNTIFYKIGLLSHKVHISPLVTQITRKEALKMSFIGTSSIKVNSSSRIFRDLGEVVGIFDENIDDLDSFEVIIRPKPSKNLGQALQPLINQPSNGIERFHIRAKAELHDRMTDFRIESSLIMRGEVKIHKNEDVFTAIERTVEENRQRVMQKVREYNEADQVESISTNAIAQYYTHDKWPGIAVDSKNTN